MNFLYLIILVMRLQTIHTRQAHKMVISIKICFCITKYIYTRIDN